MGAILRDLVIPHVWCPLVFGNLMPAIPSVGSSFRMLGTADCISPRMAFNQ
jgi:hypothetical protein